MTDRLTEISRVLERQEVDVTTVREDRVEYRILGIDTTARAIMALDKPRPLSEWHVDIGPVLWWCFPVQEPPYSGTPNDLGQTVEFEIRINSGTTTMHRTYFGGWPGYHTHWTPIPLPPAPEPQP